MSATGLRCSICRTAAGPLAWRCDRCGGVLDLDVPDTQPLDPNALPDPSGTGVADGLWRYLPWLPVDESLSLGETSTPLVGVDWDGVALSVKLEGSLPTGSFKDRGSAVMVKWLADHGASEVVVDSSGNAGASLAGYCTRAGLTCHVFAPRSAAPAKLNQVSAYGAVLHQVAGNREQVEAAAVQWSADRFYASHAWNPLFVAGIESFAYEIWDQLGRDVPDAVVIPVGAGTLLLGAARGFAALRHANLITDLPRIYGIQSNACSPLATAWADGAREPADVELRATIAEGICTRHPPRGRQILEAVAASKGGLLAVDDEELFTAHDQLARRGIYAEYTSAVAAAGVTRLVADGRLTPSDRVLVPISATGLKTAAKSITRTAT